MEPQERSSAEQLTEKLTEELFREVEDVPIVSVHNGLPARFLAQDLPITDPLALVIAHDQGVQALLRAHDAVPEVEPGTDWQETWSRRAFALVWDHLVAVRSRPWMAAAGDRLAAAGGLPPAVHGRTADEAYDEIAARLVTDPLHPRRVLGVANVAMLVTSEDPADDLLAHDVLAADPSWSGRVAPAFSADRYLQVGSRQWQTDAELLAEVTGCDTGALDGFLQALRRRREAFLAHGAALAEFHSTDLGTERLTSTQAAGLYALARAGDLLPEESSALRRHLLWEMAAMSADDGLIMAMYPPAGFHLAGSVVSERGVGARLQPLVTDFGSVPGFHLWVFSIDVSSYAAEVLPLAAAVHSVTAVPPTRYADDPAVLRAARVAAVRELGPSRALGRVDDMSGPFGLRGRHQLARRLDAAALAELVATGELSESAAVSALVSATGRSIAGSPIVPAG